MVYLFNPLYLFSNVVYIVPEKHYILVERTCWNTLIRKIFNGKRPDTKQISRLKMMFYNAYVSYMNGGKINYQSFNSALASFQEVSIPDELVKQHVPGNYVEVELNDETFFEAEFLGDDTSLPTALVDKVNGIGSSADELRDETIANLNLFMSRSKTHNDLVKLIGFGKILNTCNRLLVDRSIRFNNELERDFFLAEPSFVYDALKFHGGDLWFYCDLCESINCHNKPSAGAIRTGDSQHFEQDMRYYCRSTLIWQTGIRMDVSFGSKKLSVDRKMSELLDTSRGRFFYDKDEVTTQAQVIKLLTFDTCLKLIDDDITEFLKRCENIRFHVTGGSSTIRESMIIDKFGDFFKSYGVYDMFCEKYGVKTYSPELVDYDLLSQPEKVADNLINRSLFVGTDVKFVDSFSTFTENKVETKSQEVEEDLSNPFFRFKKGLGFE